MGVMDWFKKPTKDGDERYNEELADFVDKEYVKRQSARRPFELQWRLNQEFLNGNQYLDINTQTNTIEEIPRAYWYQEREVFNQVATIAETRLARLTRAKPIMKARPISNDESDIATARITSMLMHSSWHDQSMDDTYHDYVSWLELCGTVILKPIWDSSKGRKIDPMMGMSPTDMGTEDEMEPLQTIREGDIETSIVPAYEFFPDNNFRDDLQSCRSVIHARAYHIEEIEEMYGVKVEEEKVDVMTLQRSGSGSGGLGYASGTFRATSLSVKNHAIVKEFYEKPTTKYPNGRYIVVAGGKTLYSGDMPYMLGDDGEVGFPFIKTVSIHVPGCFWGKSTIERCIPIQRRYNALRNRKAEYLNSVAVGQWFVPIGSVDDDLEINNAPGNLIYYREGVGKPEPVQFPSLPASFENEVQTLLAEFTAVSGVSELSRFSEAPSGVKSGVALNVAVEQDDTRIGLTASRIASSIAILGKYWIRLYKQFAEEPRLLRSVGMQHEVELKEWTVSDLTTDDIVIENSAALAETPAQRRQMVFDLVNLGLFARPEVSPFTEDARQKIFQILEFGHWEDAYEDMAEIQKTRVKRENVMITEGEPPQVMDYDDHMLHVEYHNRFRMQAEYEEILRSPMGMYIDAIMRQHVEEHHMVIEVMQQQQMAQQLEQQMMEQQMKGNNDSTPK